ncbi:heavy metal sensor histidine kinase [Yersinia frederiksenii]|uniref:heavy metal sensor histidine kinase n=1 Tax=Yersinia frederiksenii TaxID=29484 RepID=UPI0011A2B8EA|nr:heavy metal sensor histidine kinase [Yersinia frederiksenii]
MRSLSLTLRLTAIFTLVMTLACIGISLTLYNALRNELLWRDDQTLINRATQLRQLLKDGASPDSVMLYFNHMVDIRQDVLAIHATGKQSIYFNHTGVPLPEIPSLSAGVYHDAKKLHRWISDAGTEVAALSLQGESEGQPVTITVARVARERTTMLATYRHESLVVCLSAVLLCAVLSPLLIREGLRCIKVLSKITAETDSGKLQHSIALHILPQELLPLGEALNIMRQRLANDFLRLTRFGDDLAHEMRTPINILLSQNQIALTYERSKKEYQALLEGNIEELENLSRLTENILFLARADHRNICLNKESFLLHEVLENMTDFLEPIAEEKNLRFILKASGSITADKILFQRALTNLLINAVYYAPNNGIISVSTKSSGEYVDISVKNTGEPLESQDKLFARFWRGDNARHTAGTGLGLSLVKAIAELHGGYPYYQHHDGYNIFGIKLNQS